MSIGKTCDVVNEYAYYNLKRVREYLIYFPLFLGRPCKISLVRQVQAYKALLWQSKICHGDSKKKETTMVRVIKNISESLALKFNDTAFRCDRKNYVCIYVYRGPSSAVYSL